MPSTSFNAPHPSAIPTFASSKTDLPTLIDALSIPTSKYCLGMQLRSEEAHKIYMQPLLTKFKYPTPQVNGANAGTINSKVCNNESIDPNANSYSHLYNICAVGSLCKVNFYTFPLCIFSNQIQTIKLCSRQ